MLESEYAQLVEKLRNKIAIDVIKKMIETNQKLAELVAIEKENQNVNA